MPIGVQCVRDTTTAADVCCSLPGAAQETAACKALLQQQGGGAPMPRCAAGVTTDCQYASAAACGGDAACPRGGDGTGVPLQPGVGDVDAQTAADDGSSGAMVAFLVLWLLSLFVVAPLCFLLGMRHQHAKRRKSLAKADSALHGIDHVDLPLSERQGAPPPPDSTMPSESSRLSAAARQSIERLSAIASDPASDAAIDVGPPPVASRESRSSFVSVDFGADRAAADESVK